MDMAKLQSCGIDYERGLRNCMGDPAFFRKILGMFLEDNCFARAREALAACDYKELFSRMHELKGVSGNTALVGLYEAVVPLVEVVREENPDDTQVAVLFAAVEDAYRRTCEGIALIMAAN